VLLDGLEDGLEHLSHVVCNVDKSVCVYYCRTYYKTVCGGGRGTVKDMYYEVRRAETCVD
jgi:hypothetical protein